MPVGVYHHDACLLHELEDGHPERPERVTTLIQLLRSERYSDKVTWHEAPRATPEEILRVHSPAHIEQLAATATRDHTRFDFDTHANRYTYEAALRSAGAGVAAIDRAMRDEPRAICVTRPPGHHAERERAMGFCFLNNVAIAAEHAIAAHGMSRVAIVDWDVHHGNGTQHHFYSRSDVFYVSIHQYPHYPGTGAAGGKGEGPGAGFTLNIPLEPGAGDDKYCRLFDTVILPLLEQYQPQMILVSAGFDGHRRDPLGGMDLTGAGYSSMAKRLCDLSGRYSDGRVVVLLEGGYDLAGLTEGVGAVVEELSLVS